MNKLSACALVLVFAASGCFWPFTGGRHPAPAGVVDDVTSVEALGAAPFQGVKKVYFEPFSAGADVSAGDALDRLALMMVKGFSDGLEGRGRFILVSGDEADTADAVIKGRIEEFRSRGYFRKTVSMKVRGDIRSASDDRVLALIYAVRQFKGKKKNSDQAAYDMGFVVARKILE